MIIGVWTCRLIGRVLSSSPVVGIGTPPTANPPESVPPPPPPPGSEGKGTLAGERGGGRVPIPTRGHTQWYSIHIYTYFVGLIKFWKQGEGMCALSNNPARHADCGGDGQLYTFINSNSSTLNL